MSFGTRQRMSIATSTATDPLFANVVVLAHMNDAQLSDEIGSTVFVDPAVVYNPSGGLFGGGATITAFSNIYYIPQSTDHFLANSTIEGFIKITSPITSQGILFGFEGDDGDLYSVFINSNNEVGIAFYTSAAVPTQFTSPLHPISLDQWVLISAQRNGNTMQLYVDGVLVSDGSMLGGELTQVNNLVVIGGIDNESFEIDELRVTDNVARYSTNFTPPTAPFPDA